MTLHLLRSRLVLSKITIIFILQLQTSTWHSQIALDSIIITIVNCWKSFWIFSNDNENFYFTWALEFRHKIVYFFSCKNCYTYLVIYLLVLFRFFFSSLASQGIECTGIEAWIRRWSFLHWWLCPSSCKWSG